MRHYRRLLWLIIVLACGGGLHCGYSTRSLIREDIGSVYMEVFDNKSFRRGLEKGLSTAVLEELKRHSGLRIADRRSADSILTGELLEVDESVVTKTEADEILLKRITVSVRFRWRDRLTGRDIVPSQTVKGSGRFVSRLGEDPFRSVFQDVAERIVESMHENW